MSLTLIQTRNDLLSKLGIEDATLAPALALQDCVVAINGAMQMLNTAGQDFFTRTRTTVTLYAGTALYALPNSVQAVLGPVRWNDTKPLRALASQGELDQFNRIFLGGDDYGSGTAGDPIAYWVDFNRSGSAGDVCAVTIQVAPAPTTPPGNLVIELVNDAPAYVVADLDDTTELPVAQNYTESVFLPIARYLITRSSQFSRPDLLAQLTEDYRTALATLGQAGGFFNVAIPAPKRESQG